MGWRRPRADDTGRRRQNGNIGLRQSAPVQERHTQPVRLSPGGSGRIFQWMPSFYLDFALSGPTGGTLQYVVSNGPLWVMRASDDFCFNPQAAVGGNGAYINSSDRRMKSNIVPTAKGLAEVLQLQPVSFTRADPTTGAQEEIGFVAQDVQSIVPEAVWQAGIPLRDGTGGLDSAEPTLGLTSEHDHRTQRQRHQGAQRADRNADRSHRGARGCALMSGAAAQQAAAPAGGMRRLPFPLESYEHPSLPLVAKRLLNLMAEKAPDDARTAAFLASTPGLVAWDVAHGGSGPIGAGPILAMNDDMPGRIYLVSGTHAYRLSFPITGGVTVEDIGTVGTADSGTGSWNSFVTIAAGPTACVVCVPPNAYTCGHDVGQVLNPIGGDVFAGATSVCYVDGYFAFSALGNSSQWFISRLLNPSDFDALDFVFSDATPNVIRRVIAHREQVWTIGEAGMEVFYNAGSSGLETMPGTSFFPFRRASGGVVPIGTVSPMSVCRADQSVWWLGVDGIVYRSNGYKALRVSTHAIEAILRNGVNGLHALTHPYSGHWFYALTTVDNRTLVYDVATGNWHERSTSTDGTGPWQASVCAVDDNSIRLFGDRASNVLYTLGMQATDAGVAVLRQATLPPLWANTNRAFCARVEVEMQVGGADTPGNVVLEWSDDGSRTWGPSRTMSSGLTSETRKRVFTTRLGSFRQRTFRISTHGLTRLYAVDADITAGAS